MEEIVVIVGAGPSGIATSACLTNLGISHLILEREDCCASLWKKRTYDRLKLHLAKEFCALPFMPHSLESPTFIPKNVFINYLDEYISTFKINPLFFRSVESASYSVAEEKWRIEAKNLQSGTVEVYSAKFLVIASGENSKSYIPEILGLEMFEGGIIHSNEYKSGLEYQEKNVLVVGCGNSGMEIAYDLYNFGAHTSIVVRNPVHVLTKEMVHQGMTLLKCQLPISVVDRLILALAMLEYGDLSKYGIHRPSNGPFFLKATAGRSPVIDVGTVEKIRTGEIQVLPAITSINKNSIVFQNGLEKEFDAIVFATGYKSVINNWLKDYQYVLDKNSMPKNSFPSHWKGEKGLYCAGLSRMGLSGISMDAQAIANDIHKVITNIE